MKETKAELQARQGKLEAELQALKGKSDSVALAQTQAKQAEIEAILSKIEAMVARTESEALKAAEAKRIELMAAAAVDCMVEQGEIAPRELDKREEWKKDFIANPSLIGKVKGSTPATSPYRASSKQAEGAIEGENRSGRGIQISSDAKGALRQMGALTASAAKDSDMLKKKAASVEIGIMYRDEIRSILAKGERLPLEAATDADNLGTLSGTLVALRTLDLFKYRFPMLDSITTDFSELPGQWNQTTATRVIVVPPVLSYSATLDGTGRPTGYTIVTTAQTLDVNVTLNNHKACPITFDANTLAATQRRLFDEQAPAVAYAMGLDLVNTLYAVITPANFTTATASTGLNPSPNPTISIAAASYGRPTFALAKQYLNTQGAPWDNRTALSNSVYQTQLEQDPSITQLAAFQMKEIITTSTLPPIANFTPIEAPNLPATAFGAKTLQAFFLHKSALVMQTRIPNDWTTVLGSGNSYGSVNVVTNPDTGISMLLVQYSQPTAAYAEYRLALMYGVASGNPRGGVIVTN